MKIVIVGLPLFGKRLCEELSSFDKGNKYIFLDTYYSRWDKLKALWHVPKADCLFSINGSMSRSGVFDLALKNNVKLIMNWVGTDVLKASESVKNNDFVEAYKTKATHFCEVKWIQKELAEIGVRAEIVNFATFDRHFKKVGSRSEKLTVLTYLPKVRAEFYGAPSLIELAKNNPDVNFIIAGSSSEDYKNLPSNVVAKGWVEDMSPLFDVSQVCIRYTEHDGLSNFILESLARGKQVIYNNDYIHCLYAPTKADLQTNLDNLKDRFNNEEDLTNEKGMNFIKNEFNSSTILGNLVERFKVN